MPLIKKQKQEVLKRLSVRIESDLLDTLTAYAGYLESSKDYVIAEAIRYIIDRDKEFAQTLPQFLPQILPQNVGKISPQAPAEGFRKRRRPQNEPDGAYIRRRNRIRKDDAAQRARSCMPRDERIVLIEDTSEIAIAMPNLVRLEARRTQPDLPAVTIRDLLRQTLRLRPDRIILGEVRGAEAFDLLQALNTGHTGTLSTIHANSARLAISRLRTCVAMAGVEIPAIPRSRATSRK